VAGATLTPFCIPSVELELYLWQDGFFARSTCFILEHYFSTRSYAECQNAFRNSFPDSVVSNKSTIQRLVERFCETGSAGEKRRSGRPSVLSNDSLEDIRAPLLQSPRKSLRKLSQQTGITYGSVQRATKYVKLHSSESFYPMCCVTFGSLCSKCRRAAENILESLICSAGHRLRTPVYFSKWRGSIAVRSQRCSTLNDVSCQFANAILKFCKLSV
jgi:transposase